MFPLSHMLRSFVRIGTLTVIDADGRTHVFSGTPGPSVTMRLTDRSLYRKLFLNPELHAGEAYMDGRLRFEDSTLRDFLTLFSVNRLSLGSYPLQKVLRTGTVVTNDDRNWELRFTQERKRINLSRAIAVDMESGTIAAQGFRLRVPYGTLLCVSDKPLHGEIKLPGAANAFYERAVAQHLEIGLKALNLLRARRDTLHSRKLRSFDEPPFR